MAAQGPSGGGGMHRVIRDRREVGPLRRLQKSSQTALGILPRFNVPGGTVADDGKRLWRWTLCERFCNLKTRRRGSGREMSPRFCPGRTRGG